MLIISTTQNQTECKERRHRRRFRSTKLGLKGKPIYEHVYGHMDDYLQWHQMTTVHM